VRPDADRARIERLLAALGRRLRRPHTVYLVGGTTAVLEGWRESTVDVDLRPEPDSDELLRALAELKEVIDVNVELASPLDFLPDLPDWRERSPWLAHHGNLDVRHLDLRLQALAKVERGFETDLADVRAMLDRGLVSADELRAALGAMEDRLFRFPAVDAPGLARRLEHALARAG
jgi:hypothetical protein